MKVEERVMIIDKVDINEDVFKLTLKKNSPLEIKPGQFVNIKVSDSDYPLLRRPISVSDSDQDSYSICIKKVGEGTRLLYKKEIGESLDVIHPLGNGFYLDNIKEKALVIGAGIGSAPMLYLAKQLKTKCNVEVDVLLGFKDKPYLIDEFKKYSEKVAVVSENDGYDYKGYVTDVLEQILDAGDYQEVFVCGPKIVMHKSIIILKNKGINPQLLMEEKMACGIGACLVCTCKINDGTGIKFKRTCKDGPVFYGEEVVFDE